MRPVIAYVLLSGGIDSTTALARAVEQVEVVRTVSIDYGQRHRRELRAAQLVAQRYGVKHEVLRVSVPRTMLTDASIPVPDVSYDEIQGVSPTYVPFRNGLMLSTLTSHIAGRHFDPTSSEEVDALIYWGAHAEDAANWAYPDCTPEFIGAMANAVFIGTYQRCRLVTPFSYAMKHEIISVGARLGVPYDLTWSCYKGGEQHCGTCATCRARRDAFGRAGEHDPTCYAS